MEDIRNLVTRRTIDRISPIEGADNIEAATVDGWTVVVKKGEFQAGDPVIYFEIDSALPVDRPEFEFLADSGVKTIEDKKYHVLKTRRLRGVYSQGLIIPVPEGSSHFKDCEEWVDFYGVIKYETPAKGGATPTKGNFPSHLVNKTDAERAQNLRKHWGTIQEQEWEATEKIDGTSVTFIIESGLVRVCSRNLELKVTEDLIQYQLAVKYGLDKMVGYIIQAEMYGEGIQGNPLGKNGKHLAVFNVLKSEDGESRAVPVPRSEWTAELLKIAAPKYDLILPATLEEALTQADGIKSLEVPSRLAEGIVWHSTTGKTFPFLGDRENFKVISNKYLLKHG